MCTYSFQSLNSNSLNSVNGLAKIIAAKAVGIYYHGTSLTFHFSGARPLRNNLMNSVCKQ